MKKSEEIRNRFYNLQHGMGYCELIEELAAVYQLTKFEVECIVNNVIDYDPEHEDVDYDDRADAKCLTCGANLNSDGVPDECCGECQAYDIISTEREEGDPEELDFD